LCCVLGHFEFLAVLVHHDDVVLDLQDLAGELIGLSAYDTDATRNITIATATTITDKRFIATSSSEM